MRLSLSSVRKVGWDWVPEKTPKGGDEQVAVPAPDTPEAEADEVEVQTTGEHEAPPEEGTATANSRKRYVCGTTYQPIRRRPFTPRCGDVAWATTHGCSFVGGAWSVCGCCC